MSSPFHIPVSRHDPSSTVPNASDRSNIPATEELGKKVVNLNYLILSQPY